MLKKWLSVNHMVQNGTTSWRTPLAESNTSVLLRIMQRQVKEAVCST
jgi:hypothetical protein